MDVLALDKRTLQQIQKPTLLIHGKDDQVIPLETSLHLLHQLPDVELHVFSRCGHWTQIEKIKSFCQ